MFRVYLTRRDDFTAMNEVYAGSSPSTSAAARSPRARPCSSTCLTRSCSSRSTRWPPRTDWRPKSGPGRPPGGQDPGSRAGARSASLLSAPATAERGPGREPSQPRVERADDGVLPGLEHRTRRATRRPWTKPCAALSDRHPARAMQPRSEGDIVISRALPAVLDLAGGDALTGRAARVLGGERTWRVCATSSG